MIGCPLLTEYPLEFDEFFLFVLILLQTKQYNWLTLIETYIKKRHYGVLPVSLSVFSNAITNTAFSVHYFHGIPYLQELKDEIVKAASAT